MAKPLELSRPNPEDVLQNFVCGTQYENLLSEWFIKIQKSLPENAFATEYGDKLEEHIKSFNGIDENSKSLGCQKSSNSSGEPFNHHEDKNDMLHGLLSKGQGDIFWYEKISKFDELATCKRTASTPTGTEDQKVYADFLVVCFSLVLLLTFNIYLLHVYTRNQNIFLVFYVKLVKTMSISLLICFSGKYVRENILLSCKQLLCIHHIRSSLSMCVHVCMDTLSCLSLIMCPEVLYEVERAVDLCKSILFIYIF